MANQTFFGDEPRRVEAFRVDGWLVDPAEGTLSRGDECRRLEPKVMRVLEHLVGHRDRLVSKHELMRAVWPDASVEEVALARSISEIRRVLGDDPRAPRFIETFPKRGYKWVALVEMEGPVARLGKDALGSVERIGPGEVAGGLGSGVIPEGKRSSAPPRFLMALGWGGCLACLAVLAVWWAREPVSPPTVAVLPFLNMNGDPDTDYFAEGLTEDVITQLSSIQGLRVTARTSMAPYRGSTKGVSEIASELGVEAIVKGSVRRQGRQLKIVGQLIDAKTDSHLWAETYHREMDQLFDVQAEVAAAIASALEAELSADEQERLATTVTHGVAYDTYLRGRAFYDRRDRASVDKAIELFEAAIELDPQYSLAYADLANAQAAKARRLRDYAIARKGVASAERALAIDAHLPEAYKALGFAYAAHDLYREAIPAYERALELRPGFWQAANNLAVTYGTIGKLDLAYRWRRKTLASDPVRALPAANFGEALRVLVLDDEASRWFQWSLRVEPFYAGAQDGLALIDMHHGRLQPARERIASQLEVDPGCRGCLIRLGLLAQLEADTELARSYYDRALDIAGDPTVVSLRLASLDAGLGRLDDATAWVERGAARPRAAIQDRSEWWGPRWSLAAASSIRGDVDDAIGFYEEAYRLGRRDYRWDQMDPLFLLARQDPRFQSVLEKMKSDVVSMRARIGEIPRPPELEARRQ